jgi:hypothetical protein
MNNSEQIQTSPTQEPKQPPNRDPFASPHHRQSTMSEDPRIAELEFENARLQRLVAELLIRNQQLRKTD